MITQMYGKIRRVLFANEFKESINIELLKLQEVFACKLLLGSWWDLKNLQFFYKNGRFHSTCSISTRSPTIQGLRAVRK